MFDLMKRDLVLYFLTGFVAIWSTTHLFVLDGLDSSTMLNIGFLVFMQIFYLIFSAENFDDKTEAYHIRKLLPISNLKIVLSKMILPFGLILMNALFAVYLLEKGDASKPFAALSYGFIYVVLSITLILSALAHALVFKFGLTNLLKILFLASPIFAIMPAAIKINFREKIYSTDWSPLVAFLSQQNWVVLVVLGLAVYIGFGFINCRILANRDF